MHSNLLYAFKFIFAFKFTTNAYPIIPPESLTQSRKFVDHITSLLDQQNNLKYIHMFSGTPSANCPVVEGWVKEGPNLGYEDSSRAFGEVLQILKYPSVLHESRLSLITSLICHCLPMYILVM